MYEIFRIVPTIYYFLFLQDLKWERKIKNTITLCWECDSGANNIRGRRIDFLRTVSRQNG